jgi:SAM-dependent methyltransferase
MKIDKSEFPNDTHFLLDLLNSDNWPEALSSSFFCSTEDEKRQRGQGVLDYIGHEFHDKLVCDFGCGEGHTALAASKTAKLAVGYDLYESGLLDWKKKDNFLLTTSCNEMLMYGPYDIIIVWDVFDHCKNPENLLMQIKAVSHKKTKFFFRFHSWISRHGAHVHKHLNKAWIHLIFTEYELELMGIKLDYLNKIYFPLRQQTKLISSIGLKIDKSEIVKNNVEPIFRIQKIKDRLPLSFFNGEFPEWQMSQSYNDYWLSHI